MPTAVHAINADHAIHAGHARNAGHATKADHAPNADKRGGSPASDFRLHCPNNLHQGADLCFDFKERTPAPLATALATCARARLRLPNEGELAEVFDNLGAQQDFEWVAEDYFPGNVPPSGALLAQNTSRQIMFNAGFEGSGRRRAGSQSGTAREPCTRASQASRHMREWYDHELPAGSSQRRK